MVENEPCDRCARYALLAYRHAESRQERIVKLREEIAQLSEANRLYLKGGRKMVGSVGDHERRLQRLQDILDELMALTDWKKL
jgi:hypothetical protein